MKKALIIGHTGQDGNILSAQLKNASYDVFGISGKSILCSDPDFQWPLSVLNADDCDRIIANYKPDEIYYLAAVHHSSSDKAIEEAELFRVSMAVNAQGLVNLLHSVKKYSPFTRVFYASSSHVFGNPGTKVQCEITEKNPVCIYGISKLAGMNAGSYYRKTHNLFVSSGILYNHESNLRADKYVSKKIVSTAVAIKNGQAAELVIGNLEARVDWGYAPDYMQAARHILSLSSPDEFVISSGETHSIKEFVEEVFDLLNLNWREYVSTNASLINKAQKKNLCGDNSKLVQSGWKPSKDFKGLIKQLVQDELKAHRTGSK